MPEGFGGEEDALGDAARFLDGSVIDDAGPRELQARELIQTLRPGSTPIPLTERGRALAQRLGAE